MITANAQGVVRGKFRIPANVSAGSKAVKFAGTGGSTASASFFGQGTLIENVMQKVTKTTVRYYDPLAQTFYLDEMRQLIGVELYVAIKGSTPMVVHLRDTVNGYPGQEVIAEATLAPAAITAAAWNRWTFPVPTTVQPGTEYCIVVMCDDAVAEIGIAEMGKWGIESQRWVTSQSPNVGVLFSSSNNATWTAHQDKDMAIRLLAARYTQTERVINLGNVVANGHTDAVILATTDVPAAGASVEIDLVQPDSSVIPSGDGQSVRFRPQVTGDVGIRARIKATDKVSAAIYPGTSMVLGTIQTSAIYVSRTFDADAFQSNIRVTFDAIMPSGSTVKVFLADDANPAVWTEITTTDTAPRPLGDGVYQFQYYMEDFNKARCRIKLELNGTSSARPSVMNLRASVTGGV